MTGAAAQENHDHGLVELVSYRTALGTQPQEVRQGQAAHSQGAVSRAVVAAVLCEDLRPAGQQASQDERLVVGLAAAVDEEAAVQVAWRPLGQLLGEGDALFRRHRR